MGGDKKKKKIVKPKKESLLDRLKFMQKDLPEGEKRSSHRHSDSLNNGVGDGETPFFFKMVQEASKGARKTAVKKREDD
jgi:hypothetical protein